MYSRVLLVLALLGLVVPGESAGLRRAAAVASLAALVETLALSEAFYIHIFYSFVWILPVCFSLSRLSVLAAKRVSWPVVLAASALLFFPLFASSARGVRLQRVAAEERSLGLIELAKQLGKRMGPGELALFHMRRVQFSPQLAFYLRHRFRYTRGISLALAQARGCKKCRFMVIARRSRSLPGSFVVAGTLEKEYESWWHGGFEVFELKKPLRPPKPAGR